MEVADLLDALVHRQKQISCHHAQCLRALADYAIASEGDEFADALEKREIDSYKAKILHGKTLPLTAELAAQVEERVLAKASDQTGAQLRSLADRVVMRVDPEGAKERVEK